MNSLPADTTSYSAHYRASAATTFATRAWIGTAFWVLLGIGLGIGVASVGNPGLGVVVGIILLIPAVISLVAALRSADKWGADDRLAVAVSDAGIALPGVGLLGWDRIVGVKAQDIGLTTGNVWFAAIQFWNGTRDNRYLAVYVRDTLEQIGQLPASARRRLTAGGPGNSYGFKGVLGQGLPDGGYAEAVAAVQAAAQARGIVVL